MEPQDFGFFALLYGIVLFFLGLQVAGIISPLMVKPDWSDKSPNKDILLGALIHWIYCAFATLLATSLASTLYWFYDTRPSISTISFAGLTTLILLQDFMRRASFMLARPGLALLSDALMVIVRCGLLYFCGRSLELTLQGSIYVMSVSCLLGLLPFIRIIAKALTDFTVSIEHSIRMCSEIWELGKWLVAQSIGYWCGAQMTIYIMGYMLSVLEVASMRAMNSIAGVAGVLFQAMENFIPRRSAEIFHEHGKAELASYTSKVIVWGGGVTAAILLPMAIFGQNLTTFLYEGKYAENAYLLWYWAVYFWFGFIQRPISFALRSLSEGKPIFVSSLVNLTSIAMCVPFIYFWKIDGAMMALCFSQFFVSAYLFTIYRKVMNHK